MKKLLVILLSLMMLFGIFAATASAADISFTDVKPSDWFYNDVKNAVNMGLVNGKSATIYAPNDNMTYAEATKLAACMYEKYTTGRVTLGNSTTGNWYDSYVEYARANGIISGNYNWNGAASRAGYMAIFAHALPESAFTAINNVPDNSIPDVGSYSYYGPDIYKLYRAGIVQGVDAKFNCDPDSNIKRSEVAAILTRMMDPSARKSFSTVPVTALTITGQPQNAAVSVGANAQFIVTVSGGKQPYAYQWHRVVASNGNKDVALDEASSMVGPKTPGLTVVGCRELDNGDHYYCVITDADGNKVTSEKALLTVGSGLTITTQPANATISAGGDATFTVAASGGTQPYTYEWHRVIKVSNYDLKITQDESLITGTKTPSLTTKNCQSDENGDQYYCVIRDANGNSVTSSKATLTVNSAALTITTQPKSTTVTEPNNAYFSVAVSGGTPPYTYQWYKSPASGASPFAITGTYSSFYSGYTTANLTAMKNYVDVDNGAKFYCVIKDAANNTVTSNKATLTVNSAALTITTQPKSTTVTQPGDAYFSVKASGGSGSYTYQWYRINPGSSSGTAISTTSSYYSGVKTANLTAKENYVNLDNGAQFYCVVTDSNNNTVTSSKATLTVKSAAAPLSALTVSRSVTSPKSGQYVTFTATPTGGTAPYTYEWLYAREADSNWTRAEDTDNTLIIKFNTVTRWWVRCEVTDSKGDSVSAEVMKFNVSN